MNRRNFLTTLVGGVAVAAAVRTWPFRVYSFPTDIKVVPRWPDQLPPSVLDALNEVTAKYLRPAMLATFNAPSPMWTKVQAQQRLDRAWQEAEWHPLIKPNIPS